MRTTLLALFIACLMGMTSANAADPLPTLNVGDTYDTTEVYRISSPLLGDNAFVEVTVTATYEVMGVESVTHTKGSMGTYTAYRLDATGTAVGNGQVNISDPIPISGPIDLVNGSFSASMWVEESTFASVKNERNISGDVQFNGLTLLSLVIAEAEEYDAPLQEHQFPLDLGNSWTQSINAEIFGDISIVPPLIPASDYEVTVPLDATMTVGAAPVNLLGCDTKEIVLTASNSPLTITNNYCCGANLFLRKEIANLPLGETGNIDSVSVEVTNFNVASDSCGVVVPTPTPMMPTPTPMPGFVGAEVRTTSAGTPTDTFNAGDPFSVELRVVTTTPVTAAIYTLVDVAGVFYTVPAFGTDFAPLVPSTQLPPLAVPYFELIGFPSPPTGGAPLTLMWYAAMIDSANGNVVGDLSVATSVHQ